MYVLKPHISTKKFKSKQMITDDVFKLLRRRLFLYKAVVLTFVRCHCEKIKMLSQYLLLFSSIRSVDFEYFLDFLALGV